jgi:hypothetical protein
VEVLFEKVRRKYINELILEALVHLDCLKVQLLDLEISDPQRFQSKYPKFNESVTFLSTNKRNIHILESAEFNPNPDGWGCI